jgi:hypothetical protein
VRRGTLVAVIALFVVIVVAAVVQTLYIGRTRPTSLLTPVTPTSGSTITP